MPSPMKVVRKGRKRRLAYRRKGAKKGVTVGGKRYQLWSRKLDRKRKSKKRVRKRSAWHTGDAGKYGI